MTDKIIYQHCHVDDLRVVPYDLQMMMNWDSHINIQYSDSGHCVQYLYKYCFKGPTQREQIEMDLEQMKDSEDEIKLCIYTQVLCSMSAMWCFYGYQDYPASTPAVCSHKVQTQQQLDFMANSGKASDLQVYYKRQPQSKFLMYIFFLVRKYNWATKLPIHYQTNGDCLDNMQSNKHYFQVLINGILIYIYISLTKVSRCIRFEMLYRTSGLVGNSNFWF
jgi:hypothetical protein